MKKECQNIREILIEKSPSDPIALEVKAHIESCEHCRKWYSELQKFSDFWAKNGLDLPNMDEILAARQNAIRRIRMKEGRHPIFRWIHSHGKWQLAFGIAMAVVVFGVGIYMGNILRKIQPETIQMAKQAIPANILKAIKSKSSGLPLDIQKAGWGLPQILAYMVKYDQNESHRLESVSELAQLEDDKMAEAALIYALRNDPNPGIRMRAIKSLAERPIKPALRDAYLYALWNDTNDGIRMEAIEALTPVAENKEVMETLKFIASSDEHEGIRHFAKDALELAHSG